MNLRQSYVFCCHFIAFSMLLRCFGTILLLFKADLCYQCAKSLKNSSGLKLGFCLNPLIFGFGQISWRPKAWTRRHYEISEPSSRVGWAPDSDESLLSNGLTPNLRWSDIMMPQEKVQMLPPNNSRAEMKCHVAASFLSHAHSLSTLFGGSVIVSCLCSFSISSITFETNFRSPFQVSDKNCGCTWP